MITLTKLNNFLDSFLKYDPKIDVSKVDERNANGLQVKGSETINKIGFGVTASTKLFRIAKKRGCQAITTHHGIRLPDTPHYQKSFQSRISFLLKSEMSLFGYHYLLDSHPKIGHNALILRSLGIKKKKEYEIKGSNWGWYGDLERAQSIKSITKKCAEIFKQKPLVYNFGDNKIKTIAAISGGGSPYGRDLQNIIERKVDLYITGEITEGIRELIRETEVNLIAGGHYATETLGVKALMKKVKEKFKNRVEVEYLELWNEV